MNTVGIAICGSCSRGRKNVRGRYWRRPCGAVVEVEYVVAKAELIAALDRLRKLANEHPTADVERLINRAFEFGT